MNFKLSTTTKDIIKLTFLVYAFSALLLAFIFGTYICGNTVLNLMNLEGWIFFITSCISHASQITLIPFVIALIPALLGFRKTALVIQCVLMSAILILAYLNEQVYALYRFHINGFVINMITGPAASDIFTFDTIVYIKEISFFIFLTALMIGIIFLAKYIFNHKHKAYVGIITSCFVGCTLFAHLWNIYANFYQHQSVMKSSQLIPYYFPTTSNRLMIKRFGLTPPQNYNNLSIGQGNGDICYPLSPLQIERPDSLPNILIIMVDSWNRRTFTPECMPNVYHWAQDNQWFTNHFSCSNGTKSSVFGFYYGFSSYYWEAFESSAIRPLFLSQLQEYGYDISTHVSAGMIDPPFARTIFGNIPDINPNSFGKTPYENDIMATNECIEHIKKHGNKPFFSYLFFDLPHSFVGIPAKDNSVFQPAWEYAKYTELNNNTPPDEFFNLYRNCCHFDDQLIARVFQTLTEENLWDNTIVILTGDHGQEFNENKKGFWGHNGNFSVYQVGIPFVIHEPGAKPHIYNHRTTHYDVIPTLMHRYLGVKNPLSDYSDGHLLTDSISRDWHVVGSNLNYAFIVKGDTILEKKAQGSLEIYDPDMNEIFNYKIDVSAFNEATKRLNKFFR